MLLKDNEKPPEKPRKGPIDGCVVAGASPEIMVMSDVVNGLYILKHIKERIRNIFVFLSLPHSFSNIPCSVYSRFTTLPYSSILLDIILRQFDIEFTKYP